MKQTRLILAAALVATILLAACGEEDGGKDSSASDAATASSSAPVAALTTDALLTDDDTVYSDGADWFRTSAYEGDGQDAFNPCAEQSLEGTGASKVVRGDYELRNTEGPATPVLGDFFTQVAGEYDDAAAATAAYVQIAEWLTDCEPRPAAITSYKSIKPRQISLDTGTAQIIDSQYGPVPKEVDPYGDSAFIMETGLLVQGNQLTVLTSVIAGQDYNFLGGTPVEQMLVPAGARLNK